MGPSFNPFASPAVLIDKLIGNAYAIVEYVARNMNHIRRCSLYMRNIYDASQRMTTLVETTMPLVAGDYVDVPLPVVYVTNDAGVTSERLMLPGNINGWRITVRALNEQIIDEIGSGAFFGVILPTGYMRLTADLTATSNVLGRPAKILFDHSIPAELVV